MYLQIATLTEHRQLIFFLQIVSTRPALAVYHICKVDSYWHGCRVYRINNHNINEDHSGFFHFISWSGVRDTNTFSCRSSLTLTSIHFSLPLSCKWRQLSADLCQRSQKHSLHLVWKYAKLFQFMVTLTTLSSQKWWCRWLHKARIEHCF